jgi:hypothetical protein
LIKVSGGFTTGPLYLPEKDPYLRVVEGAVRAPALVWEWRRGKDLLTLPRSEISFPGSQIIILIIWGFQ